MLLLCQPLTSNFLFILLSLISAYVVPFREDLEVVVEVWEAEVVEEVSKVVVDSKVNYTLTRHLKEYSLILIDI